jgi:hypothetical protein
MGLPNRKERAKATTPLRGVLRGWLATLLTAKSCCPLTQPGPYAPAIEWLSTVPALLAGKGAPLGSEC